MTRDLGGLRENNINSERERVYVRGQWVIGSTNWREIHGRKPHRSRRIFSGEQQCHSLSLSFSLLFFVLFTHPYNFSFTSFLPLSLSLLFPISPADFDLSQFHGSISVSCDPIVLFLFSVTLIPHHVLKIVVILSESPVCLFVSESRDFYRFRA